MADLILPPILQVFLDKLASPVLETFSNMLGLKDNVEKLQSKLPMVHALLEDAEEQQVTNMAVRIWLSKLKDIGHDVEDLLLDVAVYDTPITDAAWADKVRNSLRELDLIVHEGLHLNLREKSGVCREWDRRETSYFVVESEVYGREEDKGKIVELLSMSCEGVEKGSVTCIPIVGLGGLGKTTLAQLVYNDPKVSQHFDVKIWAFVSDHFDAKIIMTRIIECLTKDKCRSSNMNALHSEVWRLLQKKRYLIVLDDVWTEDEDDWDKLRPLFTGGTYGSKIVITTRSTKVALMMDCPTFPYYLNGLSEDACWSLFKRRAFRLGEVEAYENLLPIGREIVRKCGGVALAAKTLGSLMRFKREEREWLSVKESELWNLDEGKSGILPALRLSYSRLPPHLKHCFSFCSIFPRGYEIKKEKLIQMWMAEGLIRSSSGNKQQEDVGCEYFKTLQWMSFFQEVKQHDNGVVIGYKLHDVIYDLLQSIVGSECAVLHNDFQVPGSISRVRHSSVIGDFKSSLIPRDLYKASSLRTLLSFSAGNISEVPLELYSSFKYLIVLNLSGCGLITLDVSIDRLACLRYLDLSHSLIKRLPQTIENLRYLQTLNLFNCFELQELPYLLNMKNLRHLNNSGCVALTKTLSCFSIYDHILSPKKREKLLNMLAKCSKELRTLPLLVVGGPVGIMFLGQLDKLQGSLKITHLENVQEEDARVVNLTEKKGIESLGLYWGADDGDHSLNVYPEEEFDVARFQKRNEIHLASSSQGLQLGASIMGEQVLKNLQPHHNLQRLLIKGYPGITFPLDTTNFHVKAVHLIECRKAEHLPILGNLRFLESLSLQAMHRVRCIEEEFYGKSMKPFPALEELVLIDCPVLEEWSSPDIEGDAFPSLKKLVLNKCPQLTAMPEILSIQHLELRDCKRVLVHSFQNLTSLRNLAIEKVNDLTCFPDSFHSNNPLLTSLEIKSLPQFHFLPSEFGNLTSLKSLTIRWCEQLMFLPPCSQNLHALESLEISDCHSLKCFPENETQGLSNLRTLSIENCNNLTSLSMGFRFLTSLENLTIMYCPCLCKLPSGIEYLSSLRSLAIISCPQLMSLPEELQQLNVLHTLEIRSCPGLKALPNWIENLVSLRSLAISDCCCITCLPEGIKLLNMLQHLSIQDCPQLVQRCRQQSGEDWPRIAHVPYKHIGAPAQSCPSEEASSSSN